MTERLRIWRHELAVALRLTIAWRSVAAELAGWESAAHSIPNDEIRRQALASLRHKRFHCLGGAAYALDAPAESRSGLLRLIVALQTISDFLDNLCDRSASSSIDDFRALHEAFLDALDPNAPLRDYYRLHPNQEADYLPALVTTCQQELRRLPEYAAVRADCLRLGGLYAELQARKHAAADRVGLMETWFAGERERADGALDSLEWWEFGAACGSTLGIFALFALATHRLGPEGGPPATSAPAPTDERLRAYREAYFPWIDGLHILMDYGIDQAEDLAGGDLNFVSFYPNAQSAQEGIVRFHREARARAAALPGPIHLTVVDGLLGFYLSDPKVRRHNLSSWRRRILRAAGTETRFLWWCCRATRLAGVLR